MRKYLLALVTLLTLISCGLPSTAVPTFSQVSPTPSPLPPPQQLPSPSPLPPSPTLPAVPTPSPAVAVTPTPSVSVKNGKVYLNASVLIDIARDAPGCFDVGNVDYSPTGEHFVVNTSCIEGDNHAFLFRADGSEKRLITQDCNDYMNYSNHAWASDGRYLLYERVGSFGAPCPPVLPDGIVRYDVLTGEKIVLVRNAHLTPMWCSPDSRWVAFLSNYAPYLAAMDGSSLWKLDGKCKELGWEQTAAESMNLICENGGTPQTYSVKTNVGALPPGTPMPTASLTAQTLFLRPSCGKTYNVETGKPIELQYGAWGANGAERAEDNAKHLAVELFIDNQPVREQQRVMAPAFSIPCGDVPDGSYWIIHTTLIESLSPGKHTVVVIHRFDQTITDGYDSDNDGTLDRYEANDPIRQTYTLVAR